MKNDVLSELKRELKKLNKTSSRVGILIILSMTCISIMMIILFLLKSKSKDKNTGENFDQEEFYKDYYALDYEE